MKHYEEVKTTKKLFKSVTCNCCGETVELYGEDWEREVQSYKFQNLKTSFGYGSKFDNENWSFDICEDCLVNIIKQFKLVPDGFMLDEYDNLTQEEHQKVFENWKETGQWEELMFKTYEELIELSQIYDTEYINEVIKKFHPDKPLLEVEDEIE